MKEGHGGALGEGLDIRGRPEHHGDGGSYQGCFAQHNNRLRTIDRFFSSFLVIMYIHDSCILPDDNRCLLVVAN